MYFDLIESPSAVGEKLLDSAEEFSESSGR